MLLCQGFPFFWLWSKVTEQIGNSVQKKVGWSYKNAQNTDKKERTKGKEHTRMQRGANFTIVSNILPIGSKTKFSKSSQSSMYINPLFSNQLPYNNILSESK